MIRIGCFYFLLTIAVAMVSFLQVARAADHVVNAAFTVPSVDLLPLLKLVKSPTPRAVIELGPDKDGNKQLMSLSSRRDAREYNWVIFSIQNPQSKQQDLVLTIARQGFVGSGVWLPKPPASHIVGIQTSRPQPAVRLLSAGADTFALTVQPGASLTYAIELAGSKVDDVRLWRRANFDDRTWRYSFFRGVIFGISMLLAIGFSCLFIIRPNLMFPGAALFAWAALLFTFLNLGPLPPWLRSLQEFLSPTGLRAFVEVSMFAGVAVLFIALLELWRRSVLLLSVFAGLVVVAAGLVVYAFFQPALALGIARIGFAGTVAVGSVLVLHARLRGYLRAAQFVLPVAVLAAWTLLTALACFGLLPSPYVLPAMAGGLVLVLVTLGISLAQFAFGNSAGSAYFQSDAGRRALAIAGSELSVWDWQPASDGLYVGPEVARALGWPADAGRMLDTPRWLEFIHPADRAAYLSAIENAARRGRGTFSQHFRLRRGDGAFRWYCLRARVIASGDTASRIIGTLGDVTAERRTEERILADAVHDRVTGLPNKALFMDRLTRAAARGDLDTGETLYLCIVDLDRFKAVNDGLGHEIADSLLNVTGQRITQLLGPGDTVARLPGDQFALLVRTNDISQLTTDLREVLAQPVNLRPREVYVTASIGVLPFVGPFRPAADLLRDAQVALYEAKRRGSGQIMIYSAAQSEGPTSLEILQAGLERALEQSELVVFYQPVMRLSDGELAGFEALVRWNHPDRGLLEPASFIPLAEQTGLVKPISRYVLMEATRQLGIWQRAFRPNDPLFVAVNFSSEHILDYNLVKDVKNVIAREGIAPNTLKLEVTESMVMQNPELAIKILDQIRDLGVGLACDDFGTGYSALANLQRLPFDTLKLDQAFINGEGDDAAAAIILESIIVMAHDLDLQVITEGVENPEQIEQLVEFECDYVQGFYIGMPVPAQRVIAALGSVPYGQAGASAKASSLLWDTLRRPISSEDQEAWNPPPVAVPTALPSRPSINADTAPQHPPEGPVSVDSEPQLHDLSMDQPEPVDPGQSKDDGAEASIWPDEDGLRPAPKTDRFAEFERSIPDSSEASGDTEFADLADDGDYHDELGLWPEDTDETRLAASPNIGNEVVGEASETENLTAPAHTEGSETGDQTGAADETEASDESGTDQQMKGEQSAERESANGEAAPTSERAVDDAGETTTAQGEASQTSAQSSSQDDAQDLSPPDVEDDDATPDGAPNEDAVAGQETPEATTGATAPRKKAVTKKPAAAKAKPAKTKPKTQLARKLRRAAKKRASRKSS